MTPKGEQHWNWKGGTTRIFSLDNPAYRAWKKSVHSRDQYTCQLCAWHNHRGLHAHHIRPKSTHRDLAFKVNNGISLCKRCHNKLVTGREAMWIDWFESAVIAGMKVPDSIFIWFNEIILGKQAAWCECGCGGHPRFYHGRYRRFVHGHHRKGKRLNSNQLNAIKPHIFKPLPDDLKDKVLSLADIKPQRTIARELGVSQGWVSKILLANR